MKKGVIATLAAASVLSFSGVMAEEKMDEMKGMDMGAKAAAGAQATHAATGVVQKVDAKAGRVTVAHEPVKSLNWPAMTMSFKVENKSLLEKLAVGEKVQFEFVQKDTGYVVTAVN